MTNSVQPISHVIRSVVKSMGMHPYDINNGLCDNFAEEVITLLGGCSDILTETTPECETDFLVGTELPSHIWVKYNGDHYDAEEPEGVEFWWNLPLFNRLKNKPTYKSIFSKILHHEKMFSAR